MYYYTLPTMAWENAKREEHYNRRGNRFTGWRGYGTVGEDDSESDRSLPKEMRNSDPFIRAAVSDDWELLRDASLCGGSM